MNLLFLHFGMQIDICVHPRVLLVFMVGMIMKRWKKVGQGLKPDFASGKPVIWHWKINKRKNGVQSSIQEIKWTGTQIFGLFEKVLY